MKKIFTLALASLMAFSAMADGQALRAKQAPARNVAAASLQRNAAPKTGMAKLPGQTENLGEDIVYNLPAGEVKAYNRSSKQVYLGSVEEVTLPALVVFGDNNEVWFRDIFSTMATESWVKGVKDGDLITIALPQTVTLNDFYGEIYTESAMMMVYNEDDDTYVEAEDQNCVFKLNADGSMEMQGPDDGSVVIAIYEDDIFEYGNYADYGIVYEPTDLEISTIPEGLEKQDIYIVANNYATPVVLAIDDSNPAEMVAYIAGLYDLLPETAIKGSINQDKNELTFESGAVLGALTDYGFFVYFVAATASPEGDDEEIYFDYAESITLDLDLDHFKATARPGDAMVVNVLPDEIYYYACFYEPVIKEQGAFEPAAPANPSIYLYDESSFEDWGVSDFYFFLPNVDVNGNVLDNANLYYSIYTDDNVLEEFSSWDYMSLPYDTTEIPYDLNDDYDFLVYGGDHEVFLYFAGVERIGVQLIYYAPDGGRFTSAIVWNTGEVDGIASAQVAKDVVSVEYFDLAGRAVRNPAAGFFVVKTTYTDGSVASQIRSVK